MDEKTATTAPAMLQYHIAETHGFLRSTHKNAKSRTSEVSPYPGAQT